MSAFLIKNGTVFDSVTATFRQSDVAVKDRYIVSPDALLPEDKVTVIDAQGKYVVPGLIDEHLHLDLHGSMIGVNGDLLCITQGITSACDGGTCGASSFRQFYQSNITRYEATTYAYLNVQTFGNKSLCLHEEDHDPADFRPDLIEELFESYPTTLRGLKVRMCQGTLGDELGMRPLLKAKEISSHLKSRGFHCPVVVHYDNLPANVTVDDLFSSLDAGDIIAHVYQVKRETIYDAEGKVKGAVRRARERGVYMDDCHGRVHWSIPSLRRAVDEDFMPDIISSDAVRISEFTFPGFSLLYALTLQYAVGMPLEQIFKAVSATPAKALGLEPAKLTLNEGNVADLAIFDLQENARELSDNYGNTLPCKALFVPLLTMKKGRVAFRQIFF